MALHRTWTKGASLSLRARTQLFTHPDGQNRLAAGAGFAALPRLVAAARRGQVEAGGGPQPRRGQQVVKHGARDEPAERHEVLA